MSLADIDKWISGETDAFFDPDQIPRRTRPSLWKFTAILVAAICVLTVVISTQQAVKPPAAQSTGQIAEAPLPAMPQTPPLTEQANAFIISYWQSVEDSGDRVLRYLNSIYAPTVTYYGKTLPKQAVLRDKGYFLRHWPMRQSWETTSPTVSCNDAASQCEVSGIRRYNATSPKRGAHASGLVRYSYAIRFSEGSPQIVAEESDTIR